MMRKFYFLFTVVVLIYGCGTQEIQIPVDETPPELSITSPLNGAVITQGEIIISGTVSDVGAGIKEVLVLYDDTSLELIPDENGNFSKSITVSTEGSMSITIQVTDKYGNITSKTLKLLVDLTPPQVSITSPQNGSIVHGTVNISASASDTNGISGVIFYRESVEIGNITSYPFTIMFDTTQIPDGTYLFTAKAIDNAGRETTSNPVSLTIDNTPPTISINPVCADNVCNAVEAPGGMLSSPITIFTDAEDGQMIRVYSNGIEIGTGIVSGGSAEITPFEPLTEGTNLIYAVVSDLAGNYSTSPTLTVILDTSLYIQIVSPSGGLWLNSSDDINQSLPGVQIEVIISTDAEDGNIVTVTGGDSPITATVNSGFAQLEVTFSSEGTKILSAEVNDNAGNNATSNPVNVYYDDTSPTVTIISPQEGQLFKSSCPDGEGILCVKDKSPTIPLFQTDVSVAVNDNMADLNGAEVSIYSNGLLVGSGILSGTEPWTAVVSVSLRDGVNLLTAKVSDSAGNISISSEVKTYTFVGEPGSIEGYVINACSGLSIEGAVVELATDPSYITVITKTVTDASGYFKLTEIPPGQYINIRACKDHDGNGKCEINDGFGPDGAPGVAGFDDDGVNGTDDCGEYIPAGPYGDDVVADYIGFYDFSFANGPVIVLPGQTSYAGVIIAWIGDDPTPATCPISGTISDEDTSWGGINTIVGTTDIMLFGEFTPVNIRTYTVVPGGTTPQTFYLDEQPFAPTDFPLNLFVSKDLNGNGKPDLNSEPFYFLDLVFCGSTGFSYVIPPKAEIRGTVYGNSRGWVVIAISDESGSGYAGSATQVNSDSTYTLTLFGNTSYGIVASKDRDGFYLNNDNELSVMASVNPVYVGQEIIGGVDIAIPPIKTISGTVSGSGLNINKWVAEAFTAGTRRSVWIEPGSNYYLLEVFPAEYYVAVFEDKNASLNDDPREGYQEYTSKVDTLTNDVSNINIIVQPDIVLKNITVMNDTDGDRLPESGETFDLVAQFRNYGAEASNVSTTLSCLSSCTGVTINQNSVTYSLITHDELTEILPPTPYNITLSGGVPVGQKIYFQVDISADGGYTRSYTFTIIPGWGHRNGTPPGLPSSVTSISVNPSPSEIAIASFYPSVQTAYVVHQWTSSVSVIDAFNNSLITTLTLGGGTACLQDVVVSPDNRLAYVTDPCNSSIHVIITEYNMVLFTYNIDASPYYITISPDGKELWVTFALGVLIIDATTGETKKDMFFNTWFDDITFSPDGKQVFLTGDAGIIIINAEDREVQNVVKIYGTKIAIDPLSLYLYTVERYGIIYIYRLDIDTLGFTMFDYSSIGVNTSGPVALTPDGVLLYFSEKYGDDNNVYVFQTNPSPGLQYVGSFTSGTSNNNAGIVFTMEGNKSLITNMHDATVTPAE